MKEVGIFYGSSSGKTESVAKGIYDILGEERADIRDIADCTPSDLLNYNKLILGAPTWGIGELQDDWEDFIERLEEVDLSGIEVGIFGLGDQESYPDTFADAAGILYDCLQKKGCKMFGSCPTQGYHFEKSAAVRRGVFVGLILDEENQPELTANRLDHWLRELFRTG